MKLDRLRRSHAEDCDILRRIVNFFKTCRVPAVHSLGMEVEDGLVMFRGPFPSDRERRLCIELASHVGGVRGVLDRSELPPSDAKGESPPRTGAAT